LEEANCTQISGWAKNPNFTDPIVVHLYKGASFQNGGQYVTNSLANLLDEDLLYPDKEHGFSIPTPVEFKTGQKETIFIHAISKGSDNPLIEGCPMTISCK
jgi:hypothetical protein